MRPVRIWIRFFLPKEAEKRKITVKGKASPSFKNGQENPVPNGESCTAYILEYHVRIRSANTMRRAES